MYHQQITEGTLVTLDATASTGSSLTYSWAQISGTAVTRQKLHSDLRDYVTKLRSHMRWEEEHLFPKADQLAASNGEASIDVGLFPDEDPLFGATTAASFLNLLTYLQKYRVA